MFNVDKETYDLYKSLQKIRDKEGDIIHFRSKITKRGLDIDVNELMDLLEFAREQKKGKDEMTEMYVKRYENANPKKN